MNKTSFMLAGQLSYFLDISHRLFSMMFRPERCKFAEAQRRTFFRNKHILNEYSIYKAVFLIQIASFTCWVLLFGSLSPSLLCDFQSVRADLLKLDINLFPAPCVFSLFMLSTSFLCSSSREMSLHCQLY